MDGMDEAVRGYIDGIAAEHRPLFDRLHRLIMAVHPDAALVLSYQMPTYKVGNRRLYVGAWKHGVSIYGWQPGRDGGFTSRHPALKTSKGTIQLRPEDAASIPDAELSDLMRRRPGCLITPGCLHHQGTAQRRFVAGPQSVLTSPAEGRSRAGCVEWWV